MHTTISVILDSSLSDPYGISGERTYKHNASSHFNFVNLLVLNLATLDSISKCAIRVIDSNFPDTFYIIVKPIGANTMNTCKTSNPNYTRLGFDFDLSSVESFYWDQIMNGYSDNVSYACDYDDCDHEYCTVVDSFTLTRLDMLLFPELEQYTAISLWTTDQGFREYDLIDNPNPMPVYALGL